MSTHVAVHTVQVAVAVTPPATLHLPVDDLKMHVMPGVITIFPKAAVINDTNFSGPELTAMLAQGHLT
jgi:hypothetical protein